MDLKFIVIKYTYFQLLSDVLALFTTELQLFQMFGWYPSVLCDEPATISIQLGFLGTATFDSIACWSSLLTGGLYRTPAYTAMLTRHANTLNILL